MINELIHYEVELHQSKQITKDLAQRNKKKIHFFIAHK